VVNANTKSINPFMNVTGLAISTLLAMAISVWMFLVGAIRAPGACVGWTFSASMDGDTPRQTRLTQEHQLRLMAFILFLIMVAMSVSCLFWTVFQCRATTPQERGRAGTATAARQRAEQVVRTR